MPDPKPADTEHGLDLRALTWMMAALGGTVLVCALVAFLAWHGASSAPRLLAPNAPAEIHVAGVALEPSPRSVRSDYDAEKYRLLHAQEWVDADAGIARIPIDSAMRVFANRDAVRRAASPAATSRQ
jgi:hypothetical protein